MVVAATLRAHTATPSELMTDSCDWLSQLRLISQRCVDAVRAQAHVHTAGIVCVRGIMKDYSHTHARTQRPCSCASVKNTFNRSHANMGRLLKRRVRESCLSCKLNQITEPGCLFVGASMTDSLRLSISLTLALTNTQRAFKTNTKHRNSLRIRNVLLYLEMCKCCGCDCQRTRTQKE